MSSSQRCELRRAIRPGGDQTARLTPAVYFYSHAGSDEPASIFFEQLAPAVRVEILAAAVRADEGADPGTGTPVLLDALEPVHAVGAGQRATVQVRVGMDVRGGVGAGVCS